MDLFELDRESGVTTRVLATNYLMTGDAMYEIRAVANDGSISFSGDTTPLAPGWLVPTDDGSGPAGFCSACIWRPGVGVSDVLWPRVTTDSSGQWEMSTPIDPTEPCFGHGFLDDGDELLYCQHSAPGATPVHVYRRTSSLGTYTLVSTFTANIEGGMDGGVMAESADGRYVIFGIGESTLGGVARYWRLDLTTGDVVDTGIVSISVSSPYRTTNRPVAVDDAGRLMYQRRLTILKAGASGFYYSLILQALYWRDPVDGTTTKAPGFGLVYDAIPSRNGRWVISVEIPQYELGRDYESEGRTPAQTTFLVDTRTGTRYRLADFDPVNHLDPTAYVFRSLMTVGDDGTFTLPETADLDPSRPSTTGFDSYLWVNPGL
jgi:hypothetical protein